MKRSVPVSQELDIYFTDPCPVLSDNNALLLQDEVRQGYDYIVEYGMGASTIYLLEAMRDKDITMVSVENNADWFDICVNQIENNIGFKRSSGFEKIWSLSQIRNFIKGTSQVDVPDNFKRFPVWRESLVTGPFFRLSPLSKSRFSGKLGGLWPFFRPVFGILAWLYYMLRPEKRPRYCEWAGKKQDINLILRNVGPNIKDQLGEAPNRDDYIKAGLQDILADLDAGKSVSAMVIIDGGPRHWIVKKVLELEEEYPLFKPSVFLCDACRAFYRDTLARRPAGEFVAGSNRTLKGDIVALKPAEGDSAAFWTGNAKTAEDVAQQELWVYRSEQKAA